MANEVQRYAFGTIASPATTVAGTFTITYDGQTTDSIWYNADAAAVDTALELLSNIGVGDVSVTESSGVVSIEFTGALADTNVPQHTITSSLKQTASTVTTTNSTSGAADVYAAPTLGGSFSDGTNDINEAQTVSLGGATTGDFVLNGNSTSATVAPLDASGIQTACDTIWGNGNTSVSDLGLGSGNFSVTFQGSFVGQNVSEMTVSSNTTDGSPSVSTTTDGQAGTAAVQTITFSPEPTQGSWAFNGISFAFGSTPTAPSGWDISGSAGAALVTVTKQSIGSGNSEYSKSVDTLEYLATPGTYQVVTVTIPDSPTEGGLTVTIDSNTTADWGYGDSSPASLTGWTVGGSAGNWTYTRDTKAANVSHSGAESGADPLRKSLGIQSDTLTQGSAVGGPISGTAAMVFGGTNTLLGSGTLIGSGALVFGGTNALIGSGSLLGIGTLAFGGTGSVSGGSSLISGTAALAFGGTNTLTGSGAILGSGTLVFSGTNTLAGSGAILGSGALTFEATGNLSGSGTLGGSTALTFSGTNTLLGSGSLLGSGALIFGGTGNLAGSGTLGGTAALVFGGTNTILGLGALTGSGASVFGCTGSLASGGSPISGTAALAFGGTNTLIGSGSLLGSSALALGGTNSLIAVGSLTGSGALVLDGLNTLTGNGSLASLADLTFDGTGMLTGSGSVLGSVALIFDGTGSLTASGSDVVLGLPTVIGVPNSYMAVKGLTAYDHVLGSLNNYPPVISKG